MDSQKGGLRRWLVRATLIVATLGVPALAVQPGRWIHSTESDYADGKAEGVVVTNLGDIKLSMKTDTLAQMPDQAGVINDIRLLANGDLYIAAGPEMGKLLRRRKDKVEEIASLAGEQIFAMQVDAQGRLLVAISSEEHTRVAALVNDKLQTLVEIPELRYIWDFLVDGNKLVLATGAEGRVLLVDLAKAAPEAKPPEAKRPEAKPADAKPAAKSGKSATKTAKDSTAPEKKPDEKKHDEKHDGDGAASHDEPKIERAGITEILNAVQANILCLARDKQGRIYAGTDTDGLIYRVTLKADGTVGETFVVYDAPEPEIGALYVAGDGTLYAGTADAEQARPGRMNAPEAVEGGRPMFDDEHAAAPAEIPNIPPKAPPQAPAKGADHKEEKASDKKKGPVGMAPRHERSHTLAVSRVATAQFNATQEGEEEEEIDEGQNTPAKLTPAHAAGRKDKAGHGDNAPGGPGIPRRPRPGHPTLGPGGPSRIPGMPTPGGPPMGDHQGNAIYKITPDGFVSEVFRESVMILRIVEDPTPHPGSRLLVATGNEGKLYRVDPAGGETTIIAHLESQQIPALLREADGNILAATANPATLARVMPGFAAEGTFTSIVLDATQISRFGAIKLTGVVPKGTSVGVQTRTGNVEDPDAGPWSAWSEAQVIQHQPDAKPLAPFELRIKSPNARFLQYRLVLKGDSKDTPVMHRVEMSYLMPNLRPTVATIHATYGDESEAGPPPSGPNVPGLGGGSRARGMMRGPMMPGVQRGSGGSGGAFGGGGGAQPGHAEEPEPQPTMDIEWEASDPNNDHLRYTLEYQPAGSKAWVLIAKDLDQPSFEWQTRRVPDGRYLLRVTASDEPDNTADTALTAVRVSDPVVIDNAPPAIENLKVAVEKNAATITGVAKDAISSIQTVHFGLDSTEHWKPVKPDSGIFDSTNEAFTLKLTDLSPGPHVVTIRAVDSRGNPKYEAVTFEVKKEDVPKENGKKKE